MTRPAFSVRPLTAAFVALVGFTASVGLSSAAIAKDAKSAAAVQYAEIPEGVTSFGAAVIGKTLYIYGGHRGGEHDYSAEEQSDQFRSLGLSEGGKWEELPRGPKLQGLALVACRGKLYRIGGFTAKNPAEEEQDLHSSAAVGVYDPQTKKWSDGPALPSARSSHDAVVLGDKIYVAGGWTLAGKDAEPKWQDTALVLDLSAESLNWKELPKPPFQRRALSLGAADGKVYAIGGMQPDRKISMKVDVYDEKTDKWTAGPALPGQNMDGFGTSAIAAGDTVYVSNVTGKVFGFNAAAGEWKPAAELKEKRLFHRIVATADGQLLVVGGAEWPMGKAKGVYTIPVASTAATSAQ